MEEIASAFSNAIIFLLPFFFLLCHRVKRRLWHWQMSHLHLLSARSWIAPQFAIEGLLTILVAWLRLWFLVNVVVIDRETSSQPKNLWNVGTSNSKNLMRRLKIIIRIFGKWFWEKQNFLVQQAHILRII